MGRVEGQNITLEVGIVYLELLLDKNTWYHATVSKLFVLDRNTWYYVTEGKLFVLDKNTWYYITKGKLFVLDKNTWYHTTVGKLFVLDRNAWYYITGGKLFVLDRNAWYYITMLMQNYRQNEQLKNILGKIESIIMMTINHLLMNQILAWNNP